jgi:hypothetical protein
MKPLSTRHSNSRAVLRRRVQILIEDPAGNPIELFQPTIGEAKLTGTP